MIDCQISDAMLIKTLSGFNLVCSPLNAYFQVSPNIFNNINVWALCRQLHSRDIVYLLPSHGMSRSVKGGIIILKNLRMVTKNFRHTWPNVSI